MLNLVHLNSILRQVVSAPGLLHTAILMTPAGHLISYAAQLDPPRPKDEIHVVVGLSVEVWQEEKERGMGVVDSEMGRIAVLPVRNQDANELEPLMLISLNSSDKVSTEELQTKGKALAEYLSKTLSRYASHLVPQYPAAPVTTQTPSAVTSPSRYR